MNRREFENEGNVFLMFFGDLWPTFIQSGGSGVGERKLMMGWHVEGRFGRTRVQCRSCDLLWREKGREASFV